MLNSYFLFLFLYLMYLTKRESQIYTIYMALEFFAVGQFYFSVCILNLFSSGGSRYWGSMLIGAVDGYLGSGQEPDCCLYREDLVFWVHNNKYVKTLTSLQRQQLGRFTSGINNLSFSSIYYIFCSFPVCVYYLSYFIIF